MERRNFLRGLFSIAAVPSICTTKISENIKSKNTDINFSNVKMDGTFDEWVESVRTEVERLLKPVNQGDEKYIVKIESSYWDVKKSISAKSIIVSNNYGDYLGWFGLSKEEFNHCAKQPKKYLTRLVQVRFIDMLWSMDNYIADRFHLLKRFDPDYKVTQYA